MKENPTAIKELIIHSTETFLIGKYVTTYFEAVLRKLWISVEGKQEIWFSYWIDDYLAALKSPDETLRNSVVSFITPIMIKINKMSLAYVLSKFLGDFQNIGSLEPLMTLLRVARENKMICICDDTQDIRLEKGI